MKNLELLKHYSIEELITPKCEAPDFLDFSSLKLFYECPRKYYLHSIKHYQKLYGSTALRYGSVIHGMLEGFYEQIKETGWGDAEVTAGQKKAIEFGRAVWDDETKDLSFFEDFRTFEQAALSFVNYVLHYNEDMFNLEILECEDSLRADMKAESAGEKALFPNLKPFIFKGKRDLKAMWNGSLVLFDHKTTGMAISQATKGYYRTPQGFGYLYLEAMNSGKMPLMFVVNFIHTSSRKSTAKGKEGQYGKVNMKFQREPVFPCDADIYNWRLSVLSTVEDIQKNCKSGCWAMNMNSCATNYGRCPYADLCEQNRPVEDLNLENFVTRKWDPDLTLTTDIIKERNKL